MNAQPNQTSKLKPFAKTIDSFKPLFIFAKIPTSDNQPGSEHAYEIVKCKKKQKQIKQT